MCNIFQETDSISYVEAEDVAASVTIPTVDIVSHRLEVLTAPISTLSTPIKCTRRRVSMRLPILTEAQILGVKHPIVEGIADSFSTKHGLSRLAFGKGNFSANPLCKSYESSPRVP